MAQRILSYTGLDKIKKKYIYKMVHQPNDEDPRPNSDENRIVVHFVRKPLASVMPTDDC